MRKKDTTSRIGGARAWRWIAAVCAAVTALGPAAPGSAQETPYRVDLELVVEGITQPVYLAEAPDGTGRLFVVDQVGKIWIVEADGTLRPEPFLDIQDRLVALNPGYDERGLLGFAFHPEYAANGRFFVYYSAPLREQASDDWNHTSHLSEFEVSATDPNHAEADSEKVLLRFDKPQSNHNGGTLAFGPDGMLYLSVGDGGGRDDQGLGHVEDWYRDNVGGGNGQDIEQNLMGSILRLDVSEVGRYVVPPDNPFTGVPGVRAEQYAYGLRNPYRFSFDMGGDRDLIVGDAGQNLYEEVSVVEAGGNYGWNVLEGTHCFNAALPVVPFESCPQVVGVGHPLQGDPLLPPVIEFENSSTFEDGLGVVVVGGHVYRGNALPHLFDGKYFFGVWSRGNGLPGGIFVATPQEEGMWPFAPLSFGNADSLEHFLLSFSQDLDGEVYILTSDSFGPAGSSGRIFRLTLAGSVASERGADVPARIVLEGNYPNPFNPETTIRYHLAQASPVSLSVYDLLGREVVRLLDGDEVAPGTHEVRWDGTDASGARLPSGSYLYRMEAGATALSRMMTLLK